MEGDPSVQNKLRQALAGNQSAPNYLNRPVVRTSAPGRVYPIALYIETLPCTKSDSFLGLWVNNLFAMKKALGRNPEKV